MPSAEWLSIEAKVKAEIRRRRGNWPGWEKIEWREIYMVQEDLGYPLTPEQRKIMGLR